MVKKMSKPPKNAAPIEGSVDARLGKLVRQMGGKTHTPPKPGHVVLPTPSAEPCEDQLDLFTGKKAKGGKK